MRLPLNIIEMLRRRSGSDLRLPAHCEFLSLDIESQTGVHIGATTLKRLLGMTADERTPHATTLDVLARYLGFAHWQALSAAADQGNSNFEAADGELRTDELSAGSEVEIGWPPDRRVRLSYQGQHRFRVAESQNSKLCEGDEVEVQSFVLHHPLLAAGVWRDGQALGPFTGGRVSGLSSIKLTPHS